MENKEYIKYREIHILLSKYNQFPKHELIAMGFLPVDYAKRTNNDLKTVKGESQ